MDRIAGGDLDDPRVAVAEEVQQRVERALEETALEFVARSVRIRLDREPQSP